MTLTVDTDERTNGANQTHPRGDGYRVESVSQFEFSTSHSHQSKLSKNRSIFGGSAIFQSGYAVFRHFFAAGLFLPYLICIFTLPVM